VLALERLSALPVDAAYVGDSPFDMQAAKAAGLYAIGVSWGRIHGRDALGDADVVVDRAEELLAVL
jgi:phosphoglycolate phosphatase